MSTLFGTRGLAQMGVTGLDLRIMDLAMNALNDFSQRGTVFAVNRYLYNVLPIIRYEIENEGGINLERWGKKIALYLRILGSRISKDQLPLLLFLLILPFLILGGLDMAYALLDKIRQEAPNYGDIVDMVRQSIARYSYLISQLGGSGTVY